MKIRTYNLCRYHEDFDWFEFYKLHEFFPDIAHMKWATMTVYSHYRKDAKRFRITKKLRYDHWFHTGPYWYYDYEIEEVWQFLWTAMDTEITAILEQSWNTKKVKVTGYRETEVATMDVWVTVTRGSPPVPSIQ